MRRLARVLIIACALIPMTGSLPPAGAQTPVTELVWSPCAAPFATSATPWSTRAVPTGSGVRDVVGPP